MKVSDILLEAKAEKRYIITRTKSPRAGGKGGERKYDSQPGTIAELLDYYGYTLETGASYEHEKGNKKINRKPTTIQQLCDNLQKAEDNAARDGYAGVSFSYKEAPAGEVTEDVVTEGMWVIKNKDGLEKRFKVKDSPEAKTWAASSSKSKKLHPDIRAKNKEDKARMEENVDRLVWMSIMHISEWGALDWIDLVQTFALPILLKGIRADENAFPEAFVKMIQRQQRDFDFSPLRPYFNRAVKKSKHAATWDGYARQMASYAGRQR